RNFAGCKARDLKIVGGFIGEGVLRNQFGAFRAERDVTRNGFGRTAGRGPVEEVRELSNGGVSSGFIQPLELRISVEVSKKIYRAGKLSALVAVGEVSLNRFGG